jgi:long-subunit fatty acid transport protein
VIKSGVSTSIEGDARTSKFADLDSAASKAAVSSTFELPWELGLGGVYNLSDKFTLNIDFLYNLWASTQEAMQFDFDNQLWNKRLSNVDSLSGYKGSEFLLKFKNSFNLGFGIEYSAPSNIKVRFGYRYSQTPNENETYNMLFPSVDQHWISAGLGFRFEELYIDASLAYASGVETEIPKNDNFFYGGNYKMDTFLPTVKIKYEF